MAPRKIASKHYTTLSHELIDQICQYIRCGNTLRASAGLAGIRPVELQSWLNRGRLHTSGIYYDLYHEVLRARSASEIELVSVVENRAIDDWRAAAWLLERRFRQTWGKEPPKKDVELIYDEGVATDADEAINANMALPSIVINFKEPSISENEVTNLIDEF